ncbi:MAG: DUF1857 family protein [Gammaproteobacteria bacterium]|nr:DUF1857 family protein [Gammaproteobacteria bacterium]
MSSALLEFEHLIQINDPADSRVPDLSRDALWQGLVFRAKYPQHFNPALESELHTLSELEFVRILSAGDMCLRDRVTLVPDLEIHTAIEAQQSLFAKSITRIEEPEPGFLFVRFMYQRDSISDQGGLDADDYLKSAYLQNDRDAIAMIRQMVAEGWADKPI